MPAGPGGVALRRAASRGVAARRGESVRLGRLGAASPSRCTLDFTTPHSLFLFLSLCTAARFNALHRLAMTSSSGNMAVLAAGCVFAALSLVVHVALLRAHHEIETHGGVDLMRCADAPASALRRMLARDVAAAARQIEAPDGDAEAQGARLNLVRMFLRGLSMHEARTAAASTAQGAVGRALTSYDAEAVRRLSLPAISSDDASAMPDDSSLPQLVRAFRLGRFDWHELVPSVKPSGNADYDWDRLVRNEKTLAQFLTRPRGYKELVGELSESDHGPLEAYSLCETVADKCLVHEAAACARNSFCGWCPSRLLCVARWGDGRSFCPDDALELGPGGVPDLKPTHILSSGGGLDELQSASQCTHVLHEYVVLAQLEAGDTTAMYYHWWHDFYVSFFDATFGDGEPSVRAGSFHILARSRPSTTKFFESFGLMSDNCVRFVTELPEGMCVAMRASKPTGAAMELLREHVPRRLGLAPYSTAPARHRVALISRVKKRFILNELELVARARAALGVDVVLLRLEDMTLWEQLRVLRDTTVLVGQHGSGLANGLFLPDGAVMLQLWPNGVNVVDQWFEWFVGATRIYREWRNPSRATSLFHTHYLNPMWLENLDGLLSNGISRMDDPSLFFAFFIQQDMHLSSDEFEALLASALADVRLVPRTSQGDDGDDDNSGGGGKVGKDCTQGGPSLSPQATLALQVQQAAATSTDALVNLALAQGLGPLVHHACQREPRASKRDVSALLLATVAGLELVALACLWLCINAYPRARPA